MLVRLMAYVHAVTPYASDHVILHKPCVPVEQVKYALFRACLGTIFGAIGGWSTTLP